METVKHEEILIRIANALEGIDQELSSISESLVDLNALADLMKCVTNTPGGKKLCITGDVTAYQR